MIQDILYLGTSRHLDLEVSPWTLSLPLDSQYSNVNRQLKITHPQQRDLLTHSPLYWLPLGMSRGIYTLLVSFYQDTESGTRDSSFDLRFDVRLGNTPNVLLWYRPISFIFLSSLHSFSSFIYVSPYSGSIEVSLVSDHESVTL